MKAKTLPGKNFRNYKAALKQAHCPHCRQERGVIGGRFVEHPNTLGADNRPRFFGVGEQPPRCAGSGGKAVSAASIFSMAFESVI